MFEREIDGARQNAKFPKPTLSRHYAARKQTNDYLIKYEILYFVLDFILQERVKT